MIAYLDSSALLDIVLGGSRTPAGLLDFEAFVSSELLAVECLRTIDRLRVQGALSADEAVARRTMTMDWLEAVDLVVLERSILSRASEPLPVPLGTLDAIHLATALVWRDRTRQEPVMVTHDRQLALAARAFGIGLVGG